MAGQWAGRELLTPEQLSRIPERRWREPPCGSYLNLLASFMGTWADGGRLNQEGKVYHPVLRTNSNPVFPEHELLFSHGLAADLSLGPTSR